MVIFMSKILPEGLDVIINIHENNTEEKDKKEEK